MVRMRPVSMILASASLAVLLSACGGGSDIHPGDQTAQAPSASSGNPGNNNVAPNASGYWQLAGRIFQRSGQSEQSTVDVNDHVESTLEIHGRIPPATPVNGAAGSASAVTTSGTPVATETLDSLLRVEFTGRNAGTYQITTDANRFQNAGRQARLAVVRVAVRDTTTRQETSYRPNCPSGTDAAVCKKKRCRRMSHPATALCREPDIRPPTGWPETGQITWRRSG